jgi:hypothetical protein
VFAGLAASLPCSHTRVRATWAYSCLGQATRARANRASSALRARSAQHLSTPLTSVRHRLHARATRSASLTFLPLQLPYLFNASSLASHRISSCRSRSRQLNCGRRSCALLPRTHSSCAAQLLLSLSLAATVALARRPCSCTCQSRAPEPSCRQRSLASAPVPCRARSCASSPGHQPPAAACSRRRHLTEPHAPEPLFACAPLWLCARRRLPAQRSHARAPAPRQPHAPAHCRGPPLAPAEPCAARPPRTAARAAAARSGRSAPEPRQLARPSRTPALGPAPALEPAEPGAACLGRRRREREGSG